MNLPSIDLYVKDGCPWCQEVEAFLKKHHLPYQRHEVLGDTSARETMEKISGQTKAPTMQYGGEVFADFGAEELQEFLLQRGIKLPYFKSGAQATLANG